MSVKISINRSNKILCAALCSVLLAGIFSSQKTFAANADEINERAITATAISRLLAAFGTEPLAAVYTHNALTLPELFTQTNLNKMLCDPAYAKGLQTFQVILNQAVGSDLRLIWPEFSRHMSGPVVLAVVPRATDKPDEDGLFQIVLMVQVPNAGSAAKLKELWPPTAPPNSLLAFTSLRVVQSKDLPERDKIPDWATHAVSLLGRAQIGGSIQPCKIGEKLKAFMRQVGAKNDLKSNLLGLNSFEHPGIERLIFSTTFDGEYFSDELHLELAADDGSNTLAHVVLSLKEQPLKWDSLQTALPGGEDAIVLLQWEPEALGKDLPIAWQASERYLRGRKWARTKGKEPEAFAPDRFKFIFDKLQGSVGIVAHPSLSGGLRLVLATALKADDPDTFRDSLVKGFGKVGAVFQPLIGAKKIGTSVPLGATFSGHGVFGVPVIGISTGWNWFCSNSATYQDLTTAFKTGKTIAADLTREKNSEKNHTAQNWREGDALRVQIEMEKTIRLGYTAWLLSGADGPYIFGWKLPGDMLPAPAIFANRLGLLRVGFRRQKDALDGYASSVIPGIPLMGVLLLEAITDSIQRSRTFAADARMGGDTEPELLKEEKDAQSQKEDPKPTPERPD